MWLASSFDAGTATEKNFEFAIRVIRLSSTLIHDLHEATFQDAFVSSNEKAHIQFFDFQINTNEMKNFTLTMVMLLSTLLAYNQTTISGTVTDTDGEPLIGANVLAKGTTSGTITDFNGFYSLEVGAEATVLMISYTGYGTEEIEIDRAKTVYDVVLQRGILLSEAVVTALGISRDKKSLGYAVQQIDADDLNRAQQTDPLSSLAGRVAGVELKQSTNIGGSKRIVIRGANSFFGENQPLIVLDGLPINNSNYNTLATQAGSGGVDYGNMLNDLNPGDIESISVLKGAGAALYGSRAANGVLVITTKKGKAGTDNFSIDVNSAITFEEVGVMPDLQRKYGGGAIIADDDGGRSGFEVVEIEGNEYLAPQYTIDESWGPKYDPNINVLHWTAFDKESYPEDYLKPKPWIAPKNDVRTFFETGTSLVNSVALTRTTEDFGIRFSFANTTSTGVLPNSELNKNNLSFSGNARFLDNLSINAHVNYIRSETQGRPVLGYPSSGQRYGNTLGQTLFQWTHRSIDYEDSKNYANLDGTQRSWNRFAWNNPIPHYSDNHHWTTYKNYSDDERDRLVGNVGLNYQLMKGLQLTARISGDNFTFYSRERVAVGSQATPSFYEAVRNNYEYNYEAKLDYEAALTTGMRLDAMVGVNRFTSRYHLNLGETSGGLVVPDVDNLLNTAGSVLTNDLSIAKKVNSVFGRLALSIKDMIYLEGTARNDWSSALPDDNNSYFYPSVSASFIFSEPLNLSWLSFGKIRAGWANIGKDTDPYRVVPIYNFNTDGTFQGVPRIFSPKELLNVNLLPEQTTTWELGIEATLLKNRIGVDFTYFNNITTDQIIPLELSKATGYDSKFINAGEIKNNGIEVTLHLTPVKTSVFDWTVSMNYTKVNNEVVKIIDGIEAMDLVSAPFGGTFLRASVGQPYGQLWGYDYVYDDAGNRVVRENGYWARTPNLVPLGSVTPDYNIGLSNGLQYKNVNLGFLFDFQKGGKFYSVSHMWGHYAGTWGPTAGVNDQGNEIREAVSDGGGIKLEGVLADVEYNPDGSYTVSNVRPNDKYVSGQGWAARHYHAFGYPSAQSVFNADYLKLREVSLSYNLNVSSSVIIKQVQITAFGRNLWTGGLDYDGLDPEITVNGSGNIQGIEGGFLPTTRSYGFKLSLGL